MKLIISSDHAGFEYKKALIDFLQKAGHHVTDGGPQSSTPVDYPLFIIPAAERVATGEFDRGIVLGGSGNGEAIAANKVRGIRCALVWSVTTAALASEHNQANMISFGARMTSLEIAKEAALAWLKTTFAGERHQRRIEQLASYESGGSFS